MLEQILQSAQGVANSLELRFRTDRQSDGRTWTYQLISWRLPNGMWIKVAPDQPVTDAQIKTIEQVTGWTMQHLGVKLDTSDWVYQFNRRPVVRFEGL